MASKFERFNAILDSFKDIIKAKKENIHLSAVITFMNATYVKVILTWPAVQRDFNYAALNEFEDEAKQWQNLWGCVIYNDKEWAEKCGLSRQSLSESLPVIIGHHFIFPNGTISGTVMGWIVKRVAGEYQLAES